MQSGRRSKLTILGRKDDKKNLEENKVTIMERKYNHPRDDVMSLSWGGSKVTILGRK